MRSEGNRPTSRTLAQGVPTVPGCVMSATRAPPPLAGTWTVNDPSFLSLTSGGRRERERRAGQEGLVLVLHAADHGSTPRTTRGPHQALPGVSPTFQEVDTGNSPHSASESWEDTAGNCVGRSSPSSLGRLRKAGAYMCEHTGAGHAHLS